MGRASGKDAPLESYLPYRAPACCVNGKFLNAGVVAGMINRSVLTLEVVNKFICPSLKTAPAKLFCILINDKSFRIGAGREDQFHRGDTAMFKAHVA